MSNAANNIIKVLVVDDSAFMRKVISDMLNSDDINKVIGTAKMDSKPLKEHRVSKS